MGIGDANLLPPIYFQDPITLPRPALQQASNPLVSHGYGNVPVVWNRGQQFLPPTPTVDGRYVYNIVANGWRNTGLAFCYAQSFYDGKFPFVVTVDGSVVPNSDRPFLPQRVFYRDQYLIRIDEILFSSEWGRLP